MIKTVGRNCRRTLTARFDFVNLFIHMPILVFAACVLVLAKNTDDDGDDNKVEDEEKRP